MKMPSALSTWAMILYFLLAGLALVGLTFIPAIVTGIVALAAAVLLFLGR